MRRLTEESGSGRELVAIRGPRFCSPLHAQMLSQETVLVCLSKQLGEVSETCRNEVLTLAELQVANIGNLGNPTNPRAKTSTLTENCTWLAGKTVSLCVQKSRRARVESTTVSQRTRTRSSDLIVKNWLRNIFVGL